MDLVGLGWIGIGSPGGRGYRAPYGANKQILFAVFSGFLCTFAREAARGSGVVPKPSAQQELLRCLSNIIIPQV